jgi:hypothetical protein
MDVPAAPAAPADPGAGRRWPVIRAVAIAAVILIGLVDGCPLPQPNQTAAWAKGPISEVRKARSQVLEPFRFIREGLEIYQRWTLFRGSSRKRFRVWIEGRTADGVWHVLYRADDSEHTWDSEVLEYRRIRGSYNPYGQRTRGSYEYFTPWMLDRVLTRRPEMVEARLRLEKIRIQPRGGFVPTGEFMFEKTRLRGDT